MATIDHAFVGAGAGKSAVRLVLYGRVGTSSFWAMHDAAQPLLSAGTVGEVSFRHGSVPTGSSTSTALQGYGVNLDIKNMEYKVNERIHPQNTVASHVMAPLQSTDRRRASLILLLDHNDNY